MTTALPYYRTSTDDKGQDPRRQAEVVEPWAEREGVTLLEAEIDEGSSASKTDPFERKRFVAACERARVVGAAGIVVETADRFTRQGSKQDGWAEVELRRRYGLRLFRADKPLAQHGSLVGDTVDALKAEVAREWIEEHRRKVRSGMARKKAEGARFGRPAKPLKPGELALVAKLRGDGFGWGRCARAVCEARGTHRVVDPDLRRKLEVSGSHVRRAVLALPKVEAIQKVSQAG